MKTSLVTFLSVHVNLTIVYTHSIVHVHFYCHSQFNVPWIVSRSCSSPSRGSTSDRRLRGRRYRVPKTILKYFYKHIACNIQFVLYTVCMYMYMHIVLLYSGINSQINLFMYTL